MKIKYVIKSNITGKYLSHLFEDTHEKTFQAPEVVRSEVYFWDDLLTAEHVAEEENGSVEKYEWGRKD